MDQSDQRRPSSVPISRRSWLRGVATGAALAAGSQIACRLGVAAADGETVVETDGPEPRFATRGVVLIPSDLATLDWPARAKRAGLTTIATHPTPQQAADFLQKDEGQRFLEDCRKLGIEVEHELHAMSEFLPRSLFDTDPGMFRMNEQGQRVRDFNLCVHSSSALAVVAENAIKFTGLLPSTTHRYFYWIDDAQPMCRCPRCRELSDSDQALLLEHHMLEAVRQVDPQATLAHLAYGRTLSAPQKIKPQPGIFLEFAPIERLHHIPFGKRETVGYHGITHARLLDDLDANLAWFDRETAQVLEYWLDLSRFSGWQRDNVKTLPWHEDVFCDDLRTYADRGIRHVTTFAAWLDGDYVKRFGEPPLQAYAGGLSGSG